MWSKVPRHCPAITLTASPTFSLDFKFLVISHYKILGAKDKKLLYFLPRACHCFSKVAIKGVKRRVPTNNNSFLSSRTKMAQFLLKLIQAFRPREERLQVLTTKALTTCPFLILACGLAFLTVATTKLPIRL